MTNRWTHGQKVGVEQTGLSNREASAPREASCMASAAYAPPTAKTDCIFHIPCAVPSPESKGHDVLLWQ